MQLKIFCIISSSAAVNLMVILYNLKFLIAACKDITIFAEIGWWRSDNDFTLRDIDAFRYFILYYSMKNFHHFFVLLPHCDNEVNLCCTDRFYFCMAYLQHCVLLIFGTPWARSRRLWMFNFRPKFNIYNRRVYIDRAKHIYMGSNPTTWRPRRDQNPWSVLKVLYGCFPTDSRYKYKINTNLTKQCHINRKALQGTGKISTGCNRATIS